MPVVPAHEQHFPSKLLPHRIEEYVRDDGAPTTDRTYAKRVTGPQTLAAVNAAQAALGVATIDPRYFVGTCFHEAGCSNEWDTEVATGSSPTGFQSVGAFQIGDEEARRYGFALADMLDFDKSTRCMVQLAESNRAQLRTYARLAAGAPDPDYTDERGMVWKGGTMRAYLAIAHNHGTGFARQSIALNGMDWAAYKAHNPNDNIVSHGYGEDCVTGGAYWPQATPVPAPGAPLISVMRRTRLLMVTDVWMRGLDVHAVQQALRAAGDTFVQDDGTYGPETARGVGRFQRAHNLDDDQKVGDLTWRALGGAP